MRARFWAPYSTAPAIAAVANQPGRSLVRNARFYAMVSMVMDDAYLANVDAKLHYGFWRPIAAIRAGGLRLIEEDGSEVVARVAATDRIADAGVQDLVILAVKEECLDLTEVEPMRALANAVRGCIIAPEGKKLCIADLSNIEGRVLVWLAGESWKLKAFKQYDTFQLDADGNKIMRHPDQIGFIRNIQK